MKTKNKKIHKKMKFSEVIEKYPELIETLFEKGMQCFGCPVSAVETLEQGACAHGIDADELVKELNDKINK